MGVARHRRAAAPGSTARAPAAHTPGANRETPRRPRPARRRKAGAARRRRRSRGADRSAVGCADWRTLATARARALPVGRRAPPGGWPAGPPVTDAAGALAGSARRAAKSALPAPTRSGIRRRVPRGARRAAPGGCTPAGAVAQERVHFLYAGYIPLALSLSKGAWHGKKRLLIMHEPSPQHGHRLGPGGCESPLPLLRTT